MAAKTTSTGTSTLIVRNAMRPVAASAKIYRRSALAIDATGYVKPATGASTESVLIGTSLDEVDNSSGAAGAVSVNVDYHRDREVVLFKNDTADPVTIAMRERPCYVLDDQTVCATNTKAPAGIVYDVTSEGVWVEIVSMVAGPKGAPGGG